MELKEVMEQKTFAVVGDTLNEEKFACQIKHSMADHGYTVYPVGKQLSSLNDVPGELDVIDLCIHPVKGLKLMEECRKPVKCVVLQPGASSPELVACLDRKGYAHLDGCLLKGLEQYRK